MDIQLRNPVFTADGRIDCEIEHPVYGWIPFTADPNDVEQHGRDIHAAALALGPAAYVAPPPKAEEELLQEERKSMKLSFSQFVVGLTEQGWITEVEAGAWLSANSLPAAVEAAIATLPETAEDGSKPRLRARASALRPTEIERTNELLLMMAAMQGASAEQLDQFFRTYAGV